MPNLPIDQTVRRIADEVADTWFSTHGSGEIEVPLSVVGMLAFVDPQTPIDLDNARKAVPAMDKRDFAEFMKVQWEIYMNRRVDLINRAWPLAQPWFDKTRVMSDEMLRSAKAVADMAVRRGQFDLAASRHDTDILGETLMTLRGRSGQQARGQFLTPPTLAGVLAGLTGLEEGQSIIDPAVGTGGLLRAAAQSMRLRSLDPHKVHWEGVDIDYLAIACLALNIELWGLGGDVLVGVGNGLSDEWRVQAAAERRETIEIARATRQIKAFAAILSNGSAPAAPRAQVLEAGEAPQALPVPQQLDDDLVDNGGVLFAMERAKSAPKPTLVINRRRGRVESTEPTLGFDIPGVEFRASLE